MDFMTAVKTVLIEKYCCFNGRARRSEFWYFSLFSLIAGLILMFNDYASAAFSLATLLPSIGVSVRRMHDIGKSGWWVLLCLIPLVGLYLIYLCILDSEPGTNEYGENPKELAI